MLPLRTCADGLKGGATRTGARELRRVKVPAAAKEGPPYAHPYYWAAFVLIGDER
jgi:CHAT domain-containing protein